MVTGSGANAPTERFDVVIVGARVSGSPLATLLAQHGVRVAVVEQATFPSPTLSSHVMQADSLAFLNRLGVIDRIRGTGATFMTGTDTRLEHVRFVADFPALPGDPGGAACIRRHVLDPILADRAAATDGVDLRMDTKATGLLTDYRGRVEGVTVTRRGRTSHLRARLVIGADGRNSAIARLTGAREYNVTRNERWYYWTYFAGADLSPEPRFVFHRWGDRHIFAGPADDGLYIVGVSPQAFERERFRAALEPSLLEHAGSCEPVTRAIAGAERATKIFGITRFYGYFRQASGPGWMVIGDAGHFKDPAAGRGIGDAFHQVDHLVPRLVAALQSCDEVVDATTAEFGRWRDRYYSPFSWLAADLGCQGPLPVVVPDVIGRLHDRGRIHEFVNLYSHRSTPGQLITPAALAAVIGRRVVAPGAGVSRRAYLGQVRTVLAAEARHRWANRWPVYAAAGSPPSASDAAGGGDREAAVRTRPKRPDQVAAEADLAQM
jgi:2-polyprenyl-6-methoxyphenol hydroxylase-like FAD-dependent oxidoreductase